MPESVIPELLRFKDLQRLKIINNWPTLKRRVQKDGFPAGRYVGSSRVWFVAEVLAWLDARPKADDPPENLKPATLVATEGSGRETEVSLHHPQCIDSAESAQPRNGGGDE